MVPSYAANYSIPMSHARMTSHSTTGSFAGAAGAGAASGGAASTTAAAATAGASATGVRDSITPFDSGWQSFDQLLWVARYKPARRMIASLPEHLSSCME